MALRVYGHISSAPTRLVLMTCECLELDYNFVVVDILAGDHKKPEYAKVNLNKRTLVVNSYLESFWWHHGYFYFSIEFLAPQEKSYSKKILITLDLI